MGVTDDNKILFLNNYVQNFEPLVPMCLKSGEKIILTTKHFIAE